MATRARDLLQRAHRMYRSKGRGVFARGVFRHARQRAPVELWPPLLLDPVQEAAERISLHDTPSIELRYDGPSREALPRQLAAAEGRILGAEGEVYVYTDVDVVGHRPVIRSDGGYLLPSWIGVDTAYFLHQEKYLKRNLPLGHVARNAISDPTPDRVVDTGFLLLGERGLEFPAWHHEVLPKLRWLEEYEELTGESPPLILSTDIESFRKQSLVLMGYGPDTWIERGGETTRVRRLLIPPHPRRAKGTHLHTSVDGLDWVADRILSNVPDADDGFADRIYVSRRDAARRHVQNEPEVIETLHEEGFEWYEPGRLSYEEEVRLFAGADIIVGAHGKGLASIFYADDATLVEMFPRGGATEHYFLTAKECGFDYEFLSCEPVYDGRNLRPRDRDFIVDVDDLEDVVTSI